MKEDSCHPPRTTLVLLTIPLGCRVLWIHPRLRLSSLILRVVTLNCGP